MTFDKRLLVAAGEPFTKDYLYKFIVVVVVVAPLVAELFVDCMLHQ